MYINIYLLKLGDKSLDQASWKRFCISNR